MDNHGLNPHQRQIARTIARRAALLGWHHAAELHYTEGGARWQGIADGLHSEKGHYPTEADCSSFVTWCLWNALKVRFGVGDVVNGANWTAGYTGTLVNHGMHVKSLSHVRWGDAVIYGTSRSNTEHTALITHTGDNKDKRIMVISNGSEAGPFWLPYNYRSDIVDIRRYI